MPKIVSKLRILEEVGPRLSAPGTVGHHALRRRSTAPEARRASYAAGQPGVLYILDEPTTGLHFDDIQKLLGAFRKLLASGASLMVIEHNLDVIKSADWVIDLGPEGGEAGGRVVATGTPEQVARNAQSYTGKFLARVLNNHANSRGNGNHHSGGAAPTPNRFPSKR